MSCFYNNLLTKYSHKGRNGLVCFLFGSGWVGKLNSGFNPVEEF